MGVDAPAPTSKAPPHLRFNTYNNPLNNRARSPPRPPRRATPARALLLPRHGLALRRTRQRLRDVGTLDAAALGGSFSHTRAGGDINLAYMGDDQLPFLRRGVSELHVIAEPFPHVWHTLGVSINVNSFHQSWRIHHDVSLFSS